MTSKCNNNCIMCTRKVLLTGDYGQPTKKELINRLNKLDQSVDSILLTGGEPTIRKDFFDILRCINKKFPKTEIKLITNGRLFYYSSFIKKLKSIKNLYIISEFHGSNAKLHDIITRSKGSFNQTFEGIKNLLANNFKVELRIVVSKLNYKDTANIAKLYANQFKKIKRVVVFPIDIMGSAYTNKNSVIISYTESIPYIEKAIDTLKNNDLKCSLYHIPFCVIPERYHKFIKRGLTVMDKRITFVKACEDCKFKKNCPGIWRNYTKIIKLNEFKPIKNGR